MRIPLRIDDQGVVHVDIRTREAVALYTVSPGERLLDIDYDDWASHAPGVIEIRNGRLHPVPFPDPAFLKYLEENLKE